MQAVIFTNKVEGDWEQDSRIIQQQVCRDHIIKNGWEYMGHITDFAEIDTWPEIIIMRDVTRWPDNVDYNQLEDKGVQVFFVMDNIRANSMFINFLSSFRNAVIV
jgi:hypothetical protein